MKKRKLLLPLVLPVILAIILFAAWFFRNHVIILGDVYKKDLTQLDLRGTPVTEEYYTKFCKKLPQCQILWDVPFQGSCVSSTVTELTVSALTPEDIRMLGYFPQLERVDASLCPDLDAITLLQDTYPECQVIYTVALGTVLYSNDTVQLQLKNADVPELQEKLPYLPLVRRVHLSGALPTIQQLRDLQSLFPEIRFSWEVDYLGITGDCSTTTLDLSHTTLTHDQMTQLLSWFPLLEQADLRGCTLTEEEILSICAQYPDSFFLWDAQVAGLSFPTDSTVIDISGQPLDNTLEVEAMLPCFPNLETVVMSHCGIDDVTMDDLNQRYEDIRFIWSVQIGDVYVRTDAQFFYPFTFRKDMIVTTEDLYPLRYCTDMVAIDIGHMTTVTNCDWAAYMPNLKYLILAETAITDLTPLSGLKNLAFLEIFTTNITDYSPLLGCTGLEDLNLGNTYGDPAPITQMTWLKNLWWSGVHGTVGKPCSNAMAVLTEALPNTRMKFILSTPNAKNGWRQLDNYYAMRDLMGVFYLD